MAFMSHCLQTYLLALGMLACGTLLDSSPLLVGAADAVAQQHVEGFGVAEAWARILWNRFPAEAYPLYLTPLIEAGQTETARMKSRVHGILGDDDDVESYSGYFTVNKTHSSNMFFWFYPAETTPSTAPLLLWLNGGPGRSSIIGAMLENGPYEMTENGNIRRRRVSWTESFSMLYVDNPVGSGYSYTYDDEGYSTTMDAVSTNMYSVLTQFFEMFPQYRNNEFYIGGQSYAGKYIPSLGRWIHDRNKESQNPTINLKGMYLGAGFCDPVNMFRVYPDFLFNAGLVSDFYRQLFQARMDQMLNETLYENKFKETEEYLDIALMTPMIDIGADTLDHLGGGKDTVSWNHLDVLIDFMLSTAARCKLHVGVVQRMSPRKVRQKLSKELLTNTSQYNAFLMDRYKVLHYSGNMDAIVSVPMTEAFLNNVQWSGLQQYRHSIRSKWCYNGTLSVAGWYTKIANFTRVVIRNCGHMAPYDQPEWTLDMMKKFVFDIDFDFVSKKGETCANAIY